MSSESPNEGKLYERLSLISNEVIDIKGILRKVASVEEEVKTILGDVVKIKDNLVSRVNGLESMIKEAVAFAVEEAEQEEEAKEHFEKERSALVTQLKEKEETLSGKNAVIDGLEEALARKRQELEVRIREKEKLVEIRDVIMNNFKSAASSLNSLAEEITLLTDDDIVASPELGKKGAKKTESAEPVQEDTKKVAGTATSEIDTLQAELQHKNTLIAAKEMEIQSTRREMETRIQELKDQLDKQGWNQRSSRTWRAFGKST